MCTCTGKQAIDVAHVFKIESAFDIDIPILWGVSEIIIAMAATC